MLFSKDGLQTPEGGKMGFNMIKFHGEIALLALIRMIFQHIFTHSETADSRENKEYISTLSSESAQPIHLFSRQAGMTVSLLKAMNSVTAKGKFHGRKETLAPFWLLFQHCQF